MVISKRGPLPLKEQIKRQIRYLVDFGHFKRGQSLPSAKQMAQMLGVNRNTVAAVFQELAAEGLLESRVGSGTLVKNSQPAGNMMLLRDIFTEAFQKAAEAGFNTDQVEDYLTSYVALADINLRNKTALVVECNMEALNDISATLQKVLGIQTRTMLMDDLETSPEESFQICLEVDIVVCGFNHIGEFNAIIPNPPCDVVGVLLKPNLLILNELTRLDAGTRVGFICATSRSTRTFYKDFLLDAGGTRLSVAWMGMDEPDGVRELIRTCEVIFATNYVYDRVFSLAGDGVRLVRVDLSIDPANIQLVKESLKSSMLLKGEIR